MVVIFVLVVSFFWWYYKVAKKMCNYNDYRWLLSLNSICNLDYHHALASTTQAYPKSSIWAKKFALGSRASPKNSRHHRISMDDRLNNNMSNIQSFQNRMLTEIINATCSMRNFNLHRKLNLEMVLDILRRMSQNREIRHNRPNIEATCLQVDYVTSQQGWDWARVKIGFKIEHMACELRIRRK